MAKTRAAKARKPKNDTTAYASSALGVQSAPRHTPPSFSAWAGVKSLRSWMFAAASINANAVASVPLRLYVRAPGGGSKSLWRTRPVAKGRKAHAIGDGKRQPSRTVMAKTADFGADFVEVTESHPVLDLLRKVNPWMNGFDLTTWRMLSLQQSGNAYIYVPAESPYPSQYWPMPSQWTRVVPSKENWIDSYIFGRDPSSERTFSTEEIVHFRLPSLTSLYYGTGYAEMAWSAISLLESNHEYDYSMAKNHARPDYLISVSGQGATEKALDRFEASVEEKFRGESKAGKFLTVTGQVDVKPLNFAPKDMAGREDIVEEIAAIYKVPVSMLKANDPNLASAQTGFAAWREQSILPLCRLDEDTLNQRLLPMFGLENDAVLCYDDPVPENELQEWDITTKKFLIGVVTPNEIREEEGEDPIDMPHMDEPFVANRPVSLLDPQPSPFSVMHPQQDKPPQDQQQNQPPSEPVQPKAVKSLEPVAKTPMEECVSRKVRILLDEGYPQDQAVAIAYSMCGEESKLAAAKCGCGCSKPKRKASIRQSDAHLKGDPGQRVSEVPAEQSDTLTRFTRAMEKIFGEQAAEVLAIVAQNAHTPDRILQEVTAAASAGKWPTQISAAIRPVVEDALRAGADLAARGLADAAALPEPVFEFTNPEVQRYVDTATVRLANGVNSTTVVRMRSLLEDGLQAGETVDQLSARIENLGYDPARSEMIARTESARAYMQGQEEAWKQSGVVKGKKWILAPDACEFCRAAAAQYADAPIPLGQSFYPQGATLAGDQGGTMLLDYSSVDGPPLHPQCRCALVPVL